MGLCLVTKLKESVADSSLSKIGEKNIILLPEGEITMQGNNLELRAITGSFDVTPLNGSAITGVTSYVIPSGSYFTFKNPSSNAITIGVNNRSALRSLSVPDKFEQVEIGLSFFNSVVGMQELKLSRQKISDGTLADLSTITTNSILISLNFSRAIGVRGNIKDVASLRMSDSVLPNFLQCAEVIGSVEDFVAGQRANGRTSANISNNYWIAQSGITFNGKTYRDMVSISWDATTITVNGETINA